MKIKAFKIVTVTAFITSGTLVSCVADNNAPGLEYMPDMYRSPAVEAYVDYGEVEGVYDEEAQQMVEEKFSYIPPVGTIPYNTEGEYAAPYSHGGPIGVDKSHGLFEVAQDANGLEASKADLNPVPYTKQNADEGKVLYERFCIHCHGEKGDGQGTVITNGGGKFPPPSAYKKEMTPGEMFYIITYGKNAMGAHASQVTPEERWKIVHYIEKLAGKEKEIEEVLLYDTNIDSDGDGVMDSDDECPTVAGTVANHGSQEVPENVQTLVDMVDAGVSFETGSSTMTTASTALVDKLILFLQENPDYNLIINGHTDNTGSAVVNKSLSLNRAQMVKTYIANGGVDKSRVKAFGYGEYKPIANNETEEGRLANRRVEFRVYK